MTRQTGGKQAGGRSVEKSPINATSVTLHPLNMVKKEFVEQQYVLSSFPVTNLGESILDQRQGPGALSNSPWINLPGQNTLAIHQAVVYLDLTALWIRILYNSLQLFGCPSKTVCPNIRSFFFSIQKKQIGKLCSFAFNWPMAVNSSWGNLEQGHLFEAILCKWS